MNECTECNSPLNCNQFNCYECGWEFEGDSN